LDPPRLRPSTSSELRPALAALGLKQAFGSKADFSRDFVARKGEEAVEHNLPDVDKSSGNQRPPEAVL
jgi:serine protease inhibitor